MATPWKPPTLTSTRFHTIRIVDETGSTNADLLDLARAGAVDGEVLIARHQTAGRGRQGRIWLDEPDSALLMSCLVRIDASIAPLAPLVAGTAVARALTAGWDVTVGLKWPNDVLAMHHDERKLAGILAEASSTGRDVAVVIGIGINIEFSAPLPAEVEARAIDLVTVAGEPIDRSRLVTLLLEELDRSLAELEVQGAARALDSYRTQCRTLGREVRFSTGGGEVTGTATAIDASGALVIESHDGTTVTVTAGDAHHL